MISLDILWQFFIPHAPILYSWHIIRFTYCIFDILYISNTFIYLWRRRSEVLNFTLYFCFVHLIYFYTSQHKIFVQIWVTILMIAIKILTEIMMAMTVIKIWMIIIHDFTTLYNGKKLILTLFSSLSLVVTAYGVRRTADRQSGL